MKMTNFLLLLLVGAVSFCSCLSTSPPTRIFILSAPEPLRPPVVANIGKVSLPAYLERWELVSRVGEHEIKIHDFAQWGQLLPEAIRSCLQQAFQNPAGKDHREGRAPVLELSFQQFEGNQQGTFTVKGHGRLLQAGVQQELPLHFSFPYAPENEEGLVNAHQEAVKRLVVIIQEHIPQLCSPGQD